MNVVLIGGSGFVGTRLMKLLSQFPDKYSFRNIDIKPSDEFKEITESGDVRKLDDLNIALKGADLVILLAALHHDNIRPVSLYYETNVNGIKNTLQSMEKNNVRRLIFFSSTSIYGLNRNNPDESTVAAPFNDYGKSKWQAELILREWYKNHQDWNIDILRPTVIFGENNRGNVYNLLHQIAFGKFIMIGSGTNKKSMAYVGNVVEFVRYLIDNVKSGYNVFNYTDGPDMDMNELVALIEQNFYTKSSIRIPYFVGLAGGFCFDFLSKITGKNFSISSVRVKKFCSSTQFDSTKLKNTGFTPPYPLVEALERTINHEFNPKNNAL